MPAAGSTRPPSPLVTALGVFGLFTIWAGSFIAIEALLRSSDGPGRFGWLSLTAARFVPVAAICATWCFLFRRRESLELLKDHWRRLCLSGLLCVPGYNFALYAGQEREVAAPIASLLTALAPLFVMLLSALFLGERITPRRGIGFVIAATGLVIVATSKASGGVAYPLLIAMTALAPLCWSIHSVLTKPVTRTVSPLLYTYLAIVIGGAPLVPVLPFAGGPEMLTLDAAGWGLLAYLSILCTVVGFALWTWLLSRMPATSVGFTIFLNPPMTTAYKAALAALFPATVAFTLVTGEFVGGLLMLAGVGAAVIRRRPAPPVVVVPR